MVSISPPHPSVGVGRPCCGPGSLTYRLLFVFETALNEWKYETAARLYPADRGFVPWTDAKRRFLEDLKGRLEEELDGDEDGDEDEDGDGDGEGDDAATRCLAELCPALLRVRHSVY